MARPKNINNRIDSTVNKMLMSMEKAVEDALDPDVVKMAKACETLLKIKQSLNNQAVIKEEDKSIAQLMAERKMNLSEIDDEQ